MYLIKGLNVGYIQEHNWKGKMEPSGIGKSPVREAMLTKNGFINDEIAHTEFHGGPERAVCFYPFEHYDFWEKEFNRPLKNPAFGENVSAIGMLERNVYIGDVYKLGGSIIQVSQGRIPCSAISKHNNVETLLKRVVETCFTGYFFRVLEEGLVNSESTFELIDRPNSTVSIFYANNVMFHERNNIGALEELLIINELADAWKDIIKKTLNKMN